MNKKKRTLGWINYRKAYDMVDNIGTGYPQSIRQHKDICERWHGTMEDYIGELKSTTGRDEHKTWDISERQFVPFDVDDDDSIDYCAKKTNTSI